MIREKLYFTRNIKKKKPKINREFTIKLAKDSLKGTQIFYCE